MQAITHLVISGGLGVSAFFLKSQLKLSDRYW